MSLGSKVLAFARSLVLLAVVCVAVPWALVVAARARFGGGAPFHGVPSPTDWELSRIRSALTDRLSDDTVADLVVRSSLVVAWVAVVVILLTVVAELVHMVRHHGLAMPDVRGLGMSQPFARLVAAGLLVVVPLLSSPSRATARDGSSLLAGGAGPPVAMADADPLGTWAVRTGSDPLGATSGTDVRAASPASSGVGSERRERPVEGPGRHVVRPGDSVVGIAERMVGSDPTAVADFADRLIDLNLGRDMGDGQRFTNAAYLDAGWVLLLPDGTPAPPTPAAAPGTERLHVVESGESLWSIADDELGDPTRWPELYEANRGRTFGDGRTLTDPDLIHPGWQLGLPVAEQGPLDDDVASATGTDREPAGAEGPIVVPRTGPPTPLPPPVVPADAIVDAEADDVDLDEVSHDVVEAPAPRPVNAWSVDDDATTRSAPEPPADPGTRAADEQAESAPLLTMGGAAMMSGGILALLGVRRRRRLRSARPGARLPGPVRGDEATERVLRSIDAGERLERVRLAASAVAEPLIAADERVAAVLVGDDGGLDVHATGTVQLPAPWVIADGAWRLPAAVPTELLAGMANAVAPPCPTLVQLGRSEDGRDVYVDLEAIEAIEVGGTGDAADAIVAAVAATLAGSVLAEVTTLVGVGVPDEVFLGHRLHVPVCDPEQAFEVAADAIGTTAIQRRTTYELRALGTSGEMWEPTVVLVGSSVGTITPPRSRAGLAVVSASPVHGPSARLAPDGDMWALRPLGVRLVPVGLRPDDAAAVARLVDVAALDPGPTSIVSPEDDLTIAPEPDDRSAREEREPESPADDGPSWSLLVRLLGPVDVVSPAGESISFERSKTKELVAWLATHRDRSTRTSARTALWEQDVRDATFANVVSEARRSLARLVEPPPGEEWVGRTMTESLPLHDLVRTDADVVAAALQAARLQPPDQAITTLTPAVRWITGMPFEGTSYLWPDAEGLTSQLVLLATSAATELAAHCLAVGDIDGVFSATARGLQVLPGHEELIALRMEAHARFGDRAGVRHEWESYERVINADPWSDGEPSPRLVELRRSLLERSS